MIIGKEQSIQPLGRDNELNIQRSAKLYEIGVTNPETIFHYWKQWLLSNSDLCKSMYSSNKLLVTCITWRKVVPSYSICLLSNYNSKDTQTELILFITFFNHNGTAYTNIISLKATATFFNK